MIFIGLFLTGLLLIFYPYVIVFGMWLARRWYERRAEE